MTKLHCKDIVEIPILEFLYERKKSKKIWATFNNGYENSIDQCFPENTNHKVIRAKIDKLIRRGLVCGCTCGCRGDIEITEDGINYLKTKTL